MNETLDTSSIPLDGASLGRIIGQLEGELRHLATKSDVEQNRTEIANVRTEIQKTYTEIESSSRATHNMITKAAIRLFVGILVAIAVATILQPFAQLYFRPSSSISAEPATQQFVTPSEIAPPSGYSQSKKRPARISN